MRHTLQPTVLAASIVASLIGVSAHAATPAELQQIQLYNGVTIAQDSVQSWGPWEQFEAPAAGNRLPMPTFASDASNLYRPIAPVNPPVVPPVSEGSLEGFGTFTQYSGESIAGTEQATVIGKYALTPYPGSEAPAYVRGEFAPHIALGTTALPLSSTGQLDFAGSQYSSATGAITANPIEVEGIDSNAIQAWAFIVNYANGGNENTPQAEAFAGPMLGVVGIRTSDADMAALRSGNFTAIYEGKTLINNYNFAMSAKFSNASVLATITDTSLGGAKYSFFGSISGSNVLATNVIVTKGGAPNNDGQGAKVTGALSGFFTGSQAKGFIGNANVKPGENAPANYSMSDSIIAKQTKLTQPTVVTPTAK